MVWGAVAGGALQAGASIYGARKAGKAAEAAAAEAAALREEALAELRKVGIPDIEAQKIYLENPEMVWKFAPQLEQRYNDLQTAMTDIEVDPMLKDVQYQALEGIKERAEMGLTPEERAEIENLRRGTAQQEQARQSGIVRNLEERGLSDSGVGLAARLASSQQASQQSSEEADRLAAMQFQAKQGALAQLANMGTTLREQSFGEQSKVASSKDLLSQFNREQQSALQQRNVGAMNEAELKRQSLLQAQADQKSALANQQQEHNKGLLQQKYDNEMRKAQGIALALTGNAASVSNEGATKAANTAGMWSGIGTALGGVAGAFNKK
jgi:hypothetical protein